ASLLMPIFLRNYDPSITFGIPGILMLVATIVFWLGRGRYVRVPPAPANPHSFLRVARTALFAPGPGSQVGRTVALAGAVLAVGSFGLIEWLDPVPVLCIVLVVILAFGGIGASLQLDRARGHHPDDAVDGVRAVLRILIVFALITPFWSLFDQKAST